MICANCFQDITDDGNVKCINSGVDLHQECANPCVECGKPLSDTEALANRSKCKECNENVKIVVDFIRRSYIEDYKVCPYQFKLQAIDGKTGPNNGYADNGILLHDLFERATDERIPKEELELIYEKEFAEIDSYTPNQVERGLPKKELQKGLDCITMFYRTVYDKPFKASEVTIRYPIHPDLPMVQCTFDRIEEDEDGELHLIDYKTGKVHVGKKLANDLQIPLYIMAIQHEYGKLPKSFQLLFLSEGKERTYHKVSDDEYICKVNKREYKISLQETRRELNTIFSKIQKGLFQIPFGELSPWYCRNRCSMFNVHCAGVDDEAWQRGGFN